MTNYTVVCQVPKSRVLKRSRHIQKRRNTTPRSFWWGNSWGTSTRISRGKRLSERKLEVPSLSNVRVWLSAGVNLFYFCYTAWCAKIGDARSPRWTQIFVGPCVNLFHAILLATRIYVAQKSVEPTTKHYQY